MGRWTDDKCITTIIYMWTKYGELRLEIDYDVLASSINERSFEKYVCTFVYGMSFVVTLGLIKYMSILILRYITVIGPV
jgi:hypothetical protein